MRRTAAAIITLLAATTACTVEPTGTDTAAEQPTTSTTEAPPPETEAPPETEPPPPEYPAFTDIDPYTSYYFITFEDSGLADQVGERILFQAGINVCQHLDGGSSIEAELADLDGLGPITEHSGAIIGAAVTDYCPHHGHLVEAYLEENS